MPLSLVLASSSPYRRQLLERLGLPFKTASPEIDETSAPGEHPQGLARRLATEKAQALATRFSNHLIIGSDQVAALGTALLAKPGCFDRAKEQLTQASGNEVSFYTAVSLLNSRTGEQTSAVDITTVVFRPLNTKQIVHYLETEEPFDCAGSFKAEGLGIALFQQVRSEDPTALIGLPLIRLTSMLQSAGMEVL